MRISGLLLGAVITLSALTPVAPARASLITPGNLMYTDLFTWQGQYGTPTWREILAMYNCTEGLTFYLVNTPQPPSPIVVPPVAPSAPSGLPSGNPTGGFPIGPVEPSGPPGGATAVPEPSTWAMLLLGFTGLGYAGFRRSKQAVAAFA